jgi:RNA polymerase sigma-70 factor, ECF subfamily
MFDGFSSLPSVICRAPENGKEVALVFHMSAITFQQFECMPDHLVAARMGDNDAFAALVSPYIPRLQRLARRFTRNAEDAEDVCQESLLKAFTKLDRFAGSPDLARNDFRAWLTKITVNSAIDFVRRRQPHKFIPLEECDGIPRESHHFEAGHWSANPEASYARKERLLTLANALAELPAELRNVCLLRNLKGLSTREVAIRLQISAVAVRLRLFRAREELKRLATVQSGRIRRNRCRRNHMHISSPCRRQAECN